ncbi:MAG TPA: ParA family protein [Thermoanaerobaculia bacterium]|nr:ParA family protein [Thermoanaerobaculia bacterium]
MLEQALEADVADVLLLPQLTENVVFALRKAAHSGRRLQAEGGTGRHGKIVTVFSPKGGTGKTVTATNLAASFAKHEGKRALLLDLDLQFGDAAIMLGIEPEKTIYDLVVAPGELDFELRATFEAREVRIRLHECILRHAIRLGLIPHDRERDAEDLPLEAIDQHSERRAVAGQRPVDQLAIARHRGRVAHSERRHIAFHVTWTVHGLESFTPLRQPSYGRPARRRRRS